MKILAIDLKASDAVLGVFEWIGDDLHHLSLKPKKLTLATDETNDVQSFSQAFLAFLTDNEVDKIVIKQRSKKGKFAGGPTSFKLEGVIQAVSTVPVILISPQRISAAMKKCDCKCPGTLLEYQKVTFEVAYCAINLS